MNDDIATQIFGFMKVVEKLGQIKHDNKMSDGRNETDTDHILKLCYLVLMVHPYLQHKADYLKMLEIALIHDLVEAESGDFSLSAQVQNPDLKQIKKQKEKEAIEHYKSILPPLLGNKIYDLFHEYEKRQTIEARLVWVLDKLEANIQANQFNNGDIRYWKDCPNGEIYYEYCTAKKPMIEQLDEDILKEIENLVIETTKQNIKKMKRQNS